MSEARTHVLEYPVSLTLKGPSGTETKLEVTELSIPVGRRLKAKDLRCTDGHEGDIAKAIALIAHLTGQPIKVIEELDTADFEVVGNWAGELQAGRPTGATS